MSSLRAFGRFFCFKMQNAHALKVDMMCSCVVDAKLNCLHVNYLGTNAEGDNKSGRMPIQKNLNEFLLSIFINIVRWWCECDEAKLFHPKFISTR